MRKSSTLALFVLLFSLVTFGQKVGDTTITVSGCLMGINGSFKLFTHEGDTYVVKGAHSTLFSYNGMLVELTGTVKVETKSPAHGKPATLHVTRVKRLADSCQ